MEILFLGCMASIRIGREQETFLNNISLATSKDRSHFEYYLLPIFGKEINRDLCIHI